MLEIFTSLGFVLDRSNKHPVYERPADGKRPRTVVPVDDYDEFDESLIKSMILQSGFSREEFYGATKGTGKKINIRTIFVPCPKCGNQIGQTVSCAPCLAFKKAADSN
ncbi:MAG: type II toxin-antitoxin system HicA family toxin [Terracidiphilus sp.]